MCLNGDHVILLGHGVSVSCYRDEKSSLCTDPPSVLGTTIVSPIRRRSLTRSHQFFSPRRLYAMFGKNRRLVTNEPVEFEGLAGWVWDFGRIVDHFWGIYRLYLKWMKTSKPEDVNMWPVGFRITRILTDYRKPIAGSSPSERIFI